MVSEGFGFLTGALVLRETEAPVSEALLPQMTGPSVPTVDFKSIAMVRLTQWPGEPVLARRHPDQMDVIGHQTVGPDIEGVAARLPRQERCLGAVVVLGEEDRHSPGTALRYVRNE